MLVFRFPGAGERPSSLIYEIDRECCKNLIQWLSLVKRICRENKKMIRKVKKRIGTPIKANKLGNIFQYIPISGSP